MGSKSYHRNFLKKATFFSVGMSIVPLVGRLLPQMKDPKTTNEQKQTINENKTLPRTFKIWKKQDGKV
jgi:hypothetical protein